jgi:protein-S-isoprenylcysteine O-methyltransferase Ste14
MTFLEHRIPPPLVAVLCGTAMWAMAPAFSAPATALHIAATAAVALAGAFFCIAGVVSFRRAKTTVNPLKPETASALVSSGIYRISRNPMYVGFALFLLAWAVALAFWQALAGVLAFVLYINRFQILPEERALTALFGESFTAYCAHVRRWL